MKLDTYLSQPEANEAAFAASIGMSQSQINRLRRGVSKPSWETVKLIADKTRGKVTASDWAEQVNAA